MSKYANKLGVHGLVWAGGWSEPEARHAIEGAKSAGYDLVEVLLMDPLRVDARMTRRLLDEYEMEATASFGLTMDTDVSSEDPERVRAGRHRLEDGYRVARDIGVSYLGGVLYGALGKYDHPVSERGRGNSVSAVQMLCDLAAESDIRIGLEVVNRYESNVLNTARQAVDYVKTVDRENLVIHLDTYHMNIEEADNYSAVCEAGRYLGYVHVGENQRGYLGSGHVDFAGLFRGLAAIDYAGPITFESFSSRVVMPELSYTLAVWRDLWDDGFDLACAARSFIETQLDVSARRQGS